MIEPTTPDEDEAFNELERMARQRKEAVKASVEGVDKKYLSGWNSALEMAAFKIEYNFCKSVWQRHVAEYCNLYQGDEEMTAKDLRDISKFLADLHVHSSQCARRV
jgi:hypothetical protein